MRIKYIFVGMVMLSLIFSIFASSGLGTGQEDESQVSNSRGSRIMLEQEPNDSIQFANLVPNVFSGSPQTVTGSFSGPSDIDFFKVYLTDGYVLPEPVSSLTLELDAQSMNNPIYMEVHDQDGHFVARSENAQAMNKIITLTVCSEGYFYFSVIQTIVGTSGPYYLVISNDTMMENDLFDGDNSISTANYLPDIATEPGTYNQSFIHSLNDTYDFYRFNVMTGMDVKVNLTMENNADFDLYFYSLIGKQLLFSSATSGYGKSEEIVIPFLLNGTYYVRVVGRLWPMVGPTQGIYNLTIYGELPPIWDNTTRDSIELYEDQPVFYRGLDNLFVEHNKQNTQILIWNYTIADWATVSDTANMTMSIKTNSTSDRALEIQLKPNRYGVDRVHIRVEDTASNTAFRTHNITVFEINDPVSLDPTSSWTITGGTASSSPDKINGTQGTELYFNVTATDVDLNNPAPLTDTLSFDAVFRGAGTTALTELPFSIDKDSGEVRFTPDNDAVGTFTVNISVTDHPVNQDNTTVQRQITFDIANTNDPPVMKVVQVLYVEEDSLLHYDFLASDIDKADTLSFETNFTSDRVSGEFTFSSDGHLTFLPNNDDVGKHYMNITVKDADGAKDTIDIQIIVNNTNDAPVAVITSPLEGAIVVIDDDLVELDASGSYDVDQPYGDKLSYSWDLGNGETKNGKTIQYIYRLTGDYTITLTVKDLLNEMRTAVVHIKAVNVAPPDDNTSVPIPTLNLTFPLHNAIINKLETDLRWITSYIYVLDLTYDVYVYKDGQAKGAPIEKDHAEQSYHVTGLEDKTTYNWEVIPKYGLIEGLCWNGPFTFMIDQSFIPVHGVEIVFDETITMKDDEVKSYDMIVKNIGNIVDEFEITISSNEKNLKATFEESRTKTTVRINKDSQSTITFYLTTDIDIVDGQYAVTILAKSLADLTKRQELEIPVTVKTSDGGGGTNGGGKEDDEKGGESNALLYGLLIVVVIVVLVVIFFLFQKKKEREAPPETQAPSAAELTPEEALFGLPSAQPQQPEVPVQPPVIPPPVPPPVQVPVVEEPPVMPEPAQEATPALPVAAPAAEPAAAIAEEAPPAEETYLEAAEAQEAEKPAEPGDTEE